MWGGKKDKDKAAQSNGAAAKAAARPEPAPAASTPKPAPPPAAPVPAAAVPAGPGTVAQAPAAAVTPTAGGERAPEAQNALLVLGQIMSVLMASPQFANMPLSDAKALVVPAIRTGQFLIASAQPKNGQPAAPLAVVMWATVSDEVDQRLASEQGVLFRLAPNEWRSGEHAWLVAMAGDAQLLPHLVETLKKSRLGGRQLKGKAVPPPPAPAS